VWTINQRPDMDRLLGWGVDALISDRPDLAVRSRDEFVAERAR
jgi:glycerophosphoryl diester phosphodiesterase